MKGRKRERDLLVVQTENDTGSSSDDDGDLRDKKKQKKEEDPYVPEKKTTKDGKNTHPFDRVSMPGVFLVNSKSQGGKSYLIHCLMYHHRKYYKKGWGILFSNTCFNTENVTFVPKGFKHMRYDPEVLKQVLRLQAAIPKKKRPPVFIIFDDCISELQDNDKILLEAITQTPHYNIWICISTQHVNAVPSFARDNAFQIALFKVFTENGLKACYKSYGQDFPNMAEFKEKVNNKLGDHVFAFTDRQHQGPWMFLKCPPPPLPKFMLKYGPEYEKDKTDDKNRKSRKRKRSKSKERGTKKRRVEEDSELESSDNESS